LASDTSTTAGRSSLDQDATPQKAVNNVLGQDT
jgi:hypothetical protein